MRRERTSAGQRTDPAGRDGEVRYRQTPLERFAIALGTLLVALVTQLSRWATGHPLTLWTDPTAAIFLGALIGSLLYPGRGVDLTRQALVVRGNRRRAIPWSAVQGILIDRELGQSAIVVCEADGRRTRLPAPNGYVFFRNRGFEERFHTIGRWWLEHRGPGWIPVAPLIAYGTDPGPYVPAAPPAMHAGPAT